ncbi:hypothetical protein QAD02_010935 [Eretmocerus hayati]|uniref:Uncharacterized protein n=1 Tax=Eretmocerus hayati TaxID=131215 RepID=A0ACC2NVL8_9HYME|nr:hypothetical protein QAD02_010935 [Eretmocerus hayati]
MIMMVLTGDELLKMMLTSKKILRFKTLKELADSGLSLHVLNATKVDLLRYGQYNSHVQKIANRSIIIESAMDFEKNITKDVTGALIYGELVRLRTPPGPKTPNVSSRDHVLFRTIIDEIIISQMHLMKLKENSPYRERFEAVVIKLSESGLLKEYLEIFMSNTTRSAALYPRHRKENDRDIGIPLEFKLKIIIVIGNFFACATLIWEIFIKNPNQREFRCHPGKVSAQSICSNMINLKDRLKNLLKFQK